MLEIGDAVGVAWFTLGLEFWDVKASAVSSVQDLRFDLSGDPGGKKIQYVGGAFNTLTLDPQSFPDNCAGRDNRR